MKKKRKKTRRNNGGIVKRKNFKTIKKNKPSEFVKKITHWLNLLKKILAIIKNAYEVYKLLEKYLPKLWSVFAGLQWFN